MVFGGTRIDGASNITRAQARGPANEVGRLLTENVSADQALDTLSTAAEKLLKGKRLAIYDRTSDNTPRFARQYLISHERATHTVAVVRSLFERAGEKVADPALRQSLTDQLDAYLKTDDQVIRGGQLKALVDQLRRATEQAPAHLPPAAALNPGQQNQSSQQVALPVDALAPEPAPKAKPMERPMERPIEPMALGRRPQSQQIGRLGEIPEPIDSLPKGRQAVNASIAKQAESSEEAVMAIEAQAAPIELEMQASEQMDESFVMSEAEQPEQFAPAEDVDRYDWEPRAGSFAQDSGGFNRYSGEHMFRQVEDHEDLQMFLANEEFDPQALDGDRRSFTDSSRLDESFTGAELEDDPIRSRMSASLLEDRDSGEVSMDKRARADSTDFVAKVMAQRNEEAQQARWDAFVDQVDQLGEQLSDWNELLGLEWGSEPQPLQQRELKGAPKKLVSSMEELAELRETYDGSAVQRQQWGKLVGDIQGLSQALDEDLGSLLTARDGVRQAMGLFASELEGDEETAAICRENLQGAEAIEAEISPVLEQAWTLTAALDPALVRQRQDAYLQNQIDGYLAPDLEDIRQLKAKIDGADLTGRQARLGQLLSSKSPTQQEVQSIARIREELKAQRLSLLSLQRMIRAFPEAVEQVRARIASDFGAKHPDGLRMQAQVQDMAKGLDAIGQQSGQQIDSINRDLARKVVLKPVVVTDSTPDSPLIQELRSKLKANNAHLAPADQVQTFAKNLDDLVMELVFFQTATLSKAQIRQLTVDLDLKGPLINQYRLLADRMILEAVKERDQVINKAMTDHDRRMVDIRRQNQEMQRKKQAIVDIFAKRQERIDQLQSQIKSSSRLLMAAHSYEDYLGKLANVDDDTQQEALLSSLKSLRTRYADDAQIAPVLEMEADEVANFLAAANQGRQRLDDALNREIEGDAAPQVEDMAPQLAEQLRWEALPIDQLEAELAQLDDGIALSQQRMRDSEETQIRERAGALASYEERVLGLQTSLAASLQSVESALDTLRANRSA